MINRFNQNKINTMVYLSVSQKAIPNIYMPGLKSKITIFYRYWTRPSTAFLFQRTHWQIWTTENLVKQDVQEKETPALDIKVPELTIRSTVHCQKHWFSFYPWRIMLQWQEQQQSSGSLGRSLVCHANMQRSICRLTRKAKPLILKLQEDTRSISGLLGRTQKRYDRNGSSTYWSWKSFWNAISWTGQ